MVAVSATLSARSTQTTRAPSCAKSSEAARPMPLPAPVMTAVRPWRRPMECPYALPVSGRFGGAAGRCDDGVDESFVKAGWQVVAHARNNAQLGAGDRRSRRLAADLL